MKNSTSSTNLSLPSRGRAGVGSCKNFRAGAGSYKYPGKKSFISLLFFFFTVTGFAQYAPVSTIGSVDTYASATMIPITAANFSNIANCDLKIVYDPAIAVATSVTAGSSLDGIVNSNVSIPGEILISWFTFPGITLPDNTVIFNLGFSKIASGTTGISWFDDGYSCIWTDGDYNQLIDVPTASYYINGSVIFRNNNAPHTILPDISTCPGTLADIPVKVTDFTDIGKVTLTLQTDPAILGLQSWENSSGFPGLSVSTSPPGTIHISGIVPAGGPGFSLPDSAALVSLKFSYTGGSVEMTWNDNGSSCEYTGPPPVCHVLNDLPQNLFYFDGSISELGIPAPAGNISGPDGGNVCANQTGIAFSVDPIPDAVSYNWSLPEGFMILEGAGTYALTVETNDAPSNGGATVFGINACGNGLASPAFPLFINTAPPEPGNISGPEGGHVCANQTGITFSIAPIANAVSYEWSLPAGFMILAGAGTYALTVETSDAPASGDVTVAATNSCGTGPVSPAFQLTANLPPEIIAQPLSPPAVMAGTGTATFTVIADGSQLDFQWQELITSWNDILNGGVYSDVTTPSLTISQPPLSMNGYHYRCVINGTCMPAAITDGAALLTVTPVTAINGSASEIPELTVYPNPVTEATLISFDAPAGSDITLRLINMLGETIFIKNEKTDQEGTHSMIFPYKITGTGTFMLYLVISDKENLFAGQKKIIFRD